MKLVAIEVPRFLQPKPTGEEACECQKRPLETTYKTGSLFWRWQPGEAVAQGDVLCEAGIDKKTFEILSPATGELAEQTIAEGGEFSAASILGYIRAVQ